MGKKGKSPKRDVVDAVVVGLVIVFWGVFLCEALRIMELLVNKGGREAVSILAY